MSPSEIRALREKLKLSQLQVAAMIGTSQQNIDRIEKGDVQHSRFKQPLLEALLSLVAQLGDGAPPPVPDLPPSDIRVVDRVPAPRQSMPVDIPVKGIAVGGDDADFYSNGETIDYVRRPPGLANARGVYAIFVTGNSMSPRFEEGDLAFISSARPPSIGDYVVLEMVPGPQDRAGKGFIKRLKARGPNNIVCEQFNPPCEMEFDRRQVLNLHRVIPNNELYGV
jgi:phage repressor protein C with HTH and peptisase S24 domain